MEIMKKSLIIRKVEFLSPAVRKKISGSGAVLCLICPEYWMG